MATNPSIPSISDAAQHMGVDLAPAQLDQLQRYLALVQKWNKVYNLTALRDPKMELARAMAVVGLPVTVILNPKGQEVARLIGDAEWDSPDALAVLKALAAE